MMRVRRLFVKGGLVLGIAACSLPLLNPANAAPITISFNGLVSDMRDSFVAPTGTLGHQVDGSFSLKAIPGTDVAYNPMIAGLFFRFDGVSSSAAFVPGLLNGFVMYGASKNGKDRLKFGGSVAGTSLNGFDPSEFRLELKHANMFANDNLQPPSLDGVLRKSSRRLNLEDGDEARASIKGGFSQLMAVPLPAAVVLLSAGLISLVGLGAGGLRNLRKAQV